MDADLVVEKDYVERIVKYMQRDSVKISAGRVLELRHIMPYEAGMVIDVEWLKQYISEKPSTSTLGLINQIVVSSGYRVATYVDVQMWVARKTGASYNSRSHKLIGASLRKAGLAIVFLRYEDVRKRSTWYWFSGYFGYRGEKFSKSARDWLNQYQIVWYRAFFGQDVSDVVRWDNNAVITMPQQDGKWFVAKRTYWVEIIKLIGIGMQWLGRCLIGKRKKRLYNV